MSYPGSGACQMLGEAISARVTPYHVTPIILFLTTWKQLYSVLAGSSRYPILSLPASTSPFLPSWPGYLESLFADQVISSVSCFFIPGVTIIPNSHLMQWIVTGPQMVLNHSDLSLAWREGYLNKDLEREADCGRWGTLETGCQWWWMNAIVGGKDLDKQEKIYS